MPAAPTPLRRCFPFLEVIVNQRRADADARRHIFQRDAVIAELGEQLLGGIENARDRRLLDPCLVIWNTSPTCGCRGAVRLCFGDGAHGVAGCRPAAGSSTLKAEKPISRRQPRPCCRRVAISLSAKAKAPGCRSAPQTDAHQYRDNRDPRAVKRGQAGMFDAVGTPSRTNDTQ